MIAMLLSDDCDSHVIPLLNRACMLEVRGGFFIDGVEINPRGRGARASSRTTIRSAVLPAHCATSRH